MLGVAHLNVRSILNGFSEFRDLVKTLEPQIIGVGETWLSCDIPDSVINIDGYHIVRKDRRGRGGGVAIYICKNLKFKIIPTECFSFMEQLWLDVSCAHGSVCFGVVYRPPPIRMLCNFLILLMKHLRILV